jgi:hypothetical protein
LSAPPTLQEAAAVFARPNEEALGSYPPAILGAQELLIRQSSMDPAGYQAPYVKTSIHLETHTQRRAIKTPRETRLTPKGYHDHGRQEKGLTPSGRNRARSGFKWVGHDQ